MDDPSSQATRESIEPGIYWGVYESFISYIMGNPDGQIYGDDGIETDGRGQFRFPVDSFSCTADEWRIGSQGVLQFVAHMGMLNIAVARPELILTRSEGVLTIDGGKRGRVPLATVASRPPSLLEDKWLVFPPLSVTLTDEGAELFGGSYETQTEFDPVRIVLRATDETQEFGIW